MPTIVLVGAFDTKGAEYAFLADQVTALGATPSSSTSASSTS